MNEIEMCWKVLGFEW